MVSDCHVTRNIALYWVTSLRCCVTSYPLHNALRRNDYVQIFNRNPPPLSPGHTGRALIGNCTLPTYKLIFGNAVKRITFFYCAKYNHTKLDTGGKLYRTPSKPLDFGIVLSRGICSFFFPFTKMQQSVAERASARFGLVGKYALVTGGTMGMYRLTSTAMT